HAWRHGRRHADVPGRRQRAHCRHSQAENEQATPEPQLRCRAAAHDPGHRRGNRGRERQVAHGVQAQWHQPIHFPLRSVRARALAAIWRRIRSSWAGVRASLATRPSTSRSADPSQNRSSTPFSAPSMAFSRGCAARYRNVRPATSWRKKPFRSSRRKMVRTVDSRMGCASWSASRVAIAVTLRSRQMCSITNCSNSLNPPETLRIEPYCSATTSSCQTQKYRGIRRAGASGRLTALGQHFPPLIQGGGVEIEGEREGIALLGKRKMLEQGAHARSACGIGAEDRRQLARLRLEPVVGGGGIGSIVGLEPSMDRQAAVGARVDFRPPTPAAAQSLWLMGIVGGHIGCGISQRRKRPEGTLPCGGAARQRARQHGCGIAGIRDQQPIAGEFDHGEGLVRARPTGELIGNTSCNFGFAQRMSCEVGMQLLGKSADENRGGLLGLEHRTLHRDRDLVQVAFEIEARVAHKGGIRRPARLVAAQSQHAGAAHGREVEIKKGAAGGQGSNRARHRQSPAGPGAGSGQHGHYRSPAQRRAPGQGLPPLGAGGWETGFWAPRWQVLQLTSARPETGLPASGAQRRQALTGRAALRWAAVVAVLAASGAWAGWTLAVPRAVRALPPGSALFYLDLAPVRRAGVLALGGDQPRGSAYAAFVRDSGFDFERDLDQIAVSMQGSVLQPEQTTAILIGRFSQQLDSYLAAHALRKTKVAGRVAYQFPGWARPNQPLTVIELSHDRLLVTNAGDAATVLPGP